MSLYVLIVFRIMSSPGDFVSMHEFYNENSCIVAGNAVLKNRNNDNIKYICVLK